MEFKITITFNPDTKDCKVEGPLKNKELCDLGMELARSVMEQNRRKTIVSVPANAKIQLPDFRSLLKNGKKS